jgi:hypothetical protein
MRTYQLQINDTPLGKSILMLLKSAKEVVTLSPVRTKKAEKHSPLRQT